MGIFNLIKEYNKDKKKEKEEREAKVKEVADVEQNAYLEAKKNEAKILGRVRASLEREQRIKELKQNINSGKGKGITSAIFERIRIAGDNLYGEQAQKKKQKMDIFGGGL